MTTVIICLTILGLLVFLASVVIKNSKSTVESVEDQVLDKVDSVVNDATSKVTDEESGAVGTIKETVEEMETRLKNLVNVDKNKPFAKMSKPSASEAQADPQVESPSQDSAAPKKRQFKKKDVSQTSITDNKQNENDQK